MEPKKPYPTRRAALKTAAVAGSAFTLPRFSIGQSGVSANSKLNIALIGAGGVANQAYSGCANENIVALCDVDFKRAAKTKAFHDYTDVPQFADFRVMFDKMGDQIDAFVVSTPDHTHFAAAMEGMQRGKHAYVQKPLTHDIWQVRTLQKAAKHYNIISQMGNQGHATEHIRLIKEWYEAGVLGEVNEVYAWFPGPNFKSKYFRIPDSIPPETNPIPEGFDWDLWLGPAQKRPFSSYYHPQSWRSWWDFGTGMFGDWACHTIDAPVWALDLKAPTSVQAKLSPAKPGLIPAWSIIDYEFPATESRGSVKLHWYDGGKKPDILNELGGEKLASSKGGMLMIGDKNILRTGTRPNSGLQLLNNYNEIRQSGGLPPKTLPRAVGGNPFSEWIAAIKGEGPMPGSNFDYASQLTEVALLGTLVQQTGKKIEWDHENMRVKGQPEFDQLIKVPARKEWAYGEDLWKA